jgi:molybdopterin converting factor small subunit
MGDITVQILMFATARESSGTGQISLTVRSDCDTVQIRQLLAEKYPKLASMVLDEDTLTLALNEEYLLPGQCLPLKEGDTIALIPPISGG